MASAVESRHGPAFSTVAVVNLIPEAGGFYGHNIWAPDAEWFKGIKKDDEVIVLGMWDAYTSKPQKPSKEGAFKTLTKRRLTTHLVLKAQISKLVE
ncbi:hypothetical protein SFA35_12720 [Pseudomonas sp. HR96]|uniref:hypothetical protein n=1 Tax=Pseudomonas sp. HR96 TaxID=1027966 RepID=UPI002A759E4D|nr:hypothetical protein [Pseudomonas sp. HR96]WPO97539.1 hypothetical protein SFA35_12720 [Pseudomonas sp. HR96]